MAASSNSPKIQSNGQSDKFHQHQHHHHNHHYHKREQQNQPSSQSHCSCKPHSNCCHQPISVDYSSSSTNTFIADIIEPLPVSIGKFAAALTTPEVTPSHNHHQQQQCHHSHHHHHRQHNHSIRSKDLNHKHNNHIYHKKNTHKCDNKDGPIWIIIMTFFSIFLALVFGWIRDTLRYIGIEKKKGSKDPNPIVSRAYIFYNIWWISLAFVTKGRHLKKTNRQKTWRRKISLLLWSYLLDFLEINISFY